MPRTTIANVKTYDVGSSAVTFDCETECSQQRLTERGPVSVSLNFYNPETFRFELTTNPEVAGPDDLPEYEADAIIDDVTLSVTEENGELTVETEALRVVVGLDEWDFRVEEHDGTVTYAMQTHDIDVRGNPRVDSLWFDEAEINHGPHRIEQTGTAFKLRPTERIYGLGEKFGRLDRVGGEYESWHVEPLGTETERAYKNIPFHLSTAGYGLLVDTTNRVSYDLGASTSASGTITVDGDSVAWVYFHGPSLKDILATYTAFVGRPPRPPKWSFGVWMSRLGYESREQLESITARLRDESIPCDVVHLDPFWMREQKSTDLVWDTDQFPDPEGMIADLHDRDFHISLWEHPHIPVGTDAFLEARDAGYLIEDGTGKPYVMDRTCQGDYRGGILDFTNPDAVSWWKQKHYTLLEMGVDTFKTDYGEYIPEDAVFANGRSGKAMHNVYPYLYNQAVYEAIEDVHGEDDAFLWGRAAWTGSQRYPVHWGGDPQTTVNGMAAALRGGLAASISGFGFWSHDIGGFKGEPPREVYIRWAQFGLLSSHARCHGTTPREPWAFGEEAVEIFKRYARLRYQLLPYLYSYAEQAARTGMPVVRPLVLEYEDDPRTHDIETQFLLGDELLVAPVFDESGTIDVYLPEGEWYDHWTGDRFEGGQTVTVDTPLETMPIFVRAGGILLKREATQTVQPGAPEHLTAEVALPADGNCHTSFLFYDEDRDEVLTVTFDASNDVYELSTGDSAVETFNLVVRGVDDSPDTVILNDEELASDQWDVNQGELRTAL